MRPQNVATAAIPAAALLLAGGVSADQSVFKVSPLQTLMNAPKPHPVLTLTPKPSSVDAVFVEQFQDPITQSRWTISKATKQTPVGDEIFSYVGTWAVEEPEVFPGLKGDTGLVLSECFNWLHVFSFHSFP